MPPRIRGVVAFDIAAPSVFPAPFALSAAPLEVARLPLELVRARVAPERRVAPANAQIGVAEAAFLPTVTLGASGGLAGTNLSQWLTWPMRFWSIGPALSQTVIDGGFRRAQTDAALRNLLLSLDTTLAPSGIRAMSLTVKGTLAAEGRFTPDLVAEALFRAAQTPDADWRPEVSYDG